MFDPCLVVKHWFLPPVTPLCRFYEFDVAVGEEAGTLYLVVHFQTEQVIHPWQTVM